MLSIRYCNSAFLTEHTPVEFPQHLVLILSSKLKPLKLILKYKHVHQQIHDCYLAYFSHNFALGLSPTDAITPSTIVAI